MKEKIDPEITKANKEVKIACDFMLGVEEALAAAVKSNGQVLMNAVGHYVQRGADPLPDPTDPVEKLGKQCVDVYHTLARLIATIEVRDRSIVFFSLRPRLEVKTCARMAYAFGKAHGYLGVCWEYARAPEPVNGFMADLFVRCLRSALESTRVGYQELIKIGLEENP